MGLENYVEIDDSDAKVTIVRCKHDMASEQASQAVKTALAGIKKGSVIINLSKVNVVGHSFLVTINNANAEGYNIALVGVQPSVNGALAMSHFNNIIAIYGSEKKAIRILNEE